MDILAFLIVGLIAGWIAGEMMKGEGFGILGNIIVGIVGALVGGFLFNLLGVEAGGFLGQLIMATVGAVVLLFLIGLAQRRGA
jgi:uncharacterized membrane protein YeaQ/YmgE (transglycosylase-associated protein family)